MEIHEQCTLRDLFSLELAMQAKKFECVQL